MQGASQAARNVLRLIENQPTRAFEYRDKGSMAIVGRGSAIADFGWTTLSGVVAWFAWLFIHIFMLIGFRNRLAVLLQWGTAYMTFQRSVRLITYDTKAAGQ
jgi:NADH dehydrogenase